MNLIGQLKKARPSPRRPRSTARIRHQAREGQRLDYKLSCFLETLGIPKNSLEDCSVATEGGSTRKKAVVSGRELDLGLERLSGCR